MKHFFIFLLALSLIGLIVFTAAGGGSVKIKKLYSAVYNKTVSALKLGQQSALQRYEDKKKSAHAVDSDYKYGDQPPSAISEVLVQRVSSSSTLNSSETASSSEEDFAAAISKDKEIENIVPSSDLTASGANTPYSEQTPSPLFRQGEEKTPFSDKTGIPWIDSSSSHFNLKVEPHNKTIMTPNLGMRFETVYQILNRNISWMLGGKASVYVYQNKADFLKYEPSAAAWSGAFYSASQNRIVMYDDPKNTDKMISHFMHELTHLFVQNFFNPPDRKIDVEPPIWLNEGLAVNMEDIAINNNGGIWNDDLIYAVISQQARAVKSAPARESGGTKIATLQTVNSPLSLGTRARMFNTNQGIKFQNFRDFVKMESYDKAEKAGQTEVWYFQAFAMVRFLFRPDESMQPKKRIQFEHFTELLSDIQEKRDENGKLLRNARGQIMLQRTSLETALNKAYGFKTIEDFEDKFWSWLYQYQDDQLSRNRSD